MARRPRRPRIGDWLVVSDESGFVTTRSRVAERWDGAIVRNDRREMEGRHPQEFVRALDDPEPVRPVRPRPEVGRWREP